jgi:hypothetical protein
LKEIGSTGKDGEQDYPELRETLTRLQTADETKAVPATRHPAAVAASEPPPVQEQAAPVQASPPAENPRKKDESPRKPSRGKIGGLLASADWCSLPTCEFPWVLQPPIAQLLICLHHR